MTAFYEGEIDHDLSAAWSTDPRSTAHTIADTMRHVMTAQPEVQVIRDHYRETKDAGLRGLIAGMMQPLKGEG